MERALLLAAAVFPFLSTDELEGASFSRRRECGARRPTIFLGGMYRGHYTNITEVWVVSHAFAYGLLVATMSTCALRITIVQIKR